MADNRSLDRKCSTDLIEGCCWLALVTLAGIYTFQFDDPLPVYKWGPAHWPRVVLLGMTVAGFWLVYQYFVSQKSSLNHVESANLKSTDSDQNQLTSFAKARIVLIFALPILYTFLIHKMGFLLITPFFLFVYMYVMGVRRLRTLIVVTISIYAGLVLVFVKLIFTYLPPGAGVFNAINGIILGWLT